MNDSTKLRSILMVGLLAVLTVMLAGIRPLAAEPNAFALELKVSPPGSGSASANPSGPYAGPTAVTLSATANPEWVFEKWVEGNSGGNWWDAKWDYRAVLTAGAGNFARKDKAAEFDINFTTLWTSLGVANTLDPDAMRVVEIDSNDNVIDSSVPFQFDKAANFNALTNASGTLVVLMEGDTPANTSRRYHVYFDIAGKGNTPPNFPKQVIVTDNLTDQTVDVFRVQTGTNGTYYLHKQGGGFTSIVDKDSNDWLNWKPTPVSDAGYYRGLPNAVSPKKGDYFHPGVTTMQSTIVSEGPVKATIRVISVGGVAPNGWEGFYEFYPNYVTFTMTKAKEDFWFLYEGTPGGEFEKQSDFMGRSSTQNNANPELKTIPWPFAVDFDPEEWAFIGDDSLSYTFFMANNTNDKKQEYSGHQEFMYIFGFGRKDNLILLPKDLLPREFTFGFIDGTTLDNAPPLIYSAYKNLSNNVGTAEYNSGTELGSTTPLPFNITGEHIVTAFFKPAATYTVGTGVSPQGAGSVTKNPPGPTYNPGTVVTLQAFANPGYVFKEWTGPDPVANPTANPTTIVTSGGNKNVTAVFDVIPTYPITTQPQPAGSGTIALNPPGGSYIEGQQVVLTPTANTGFTFVGWSGDVDPADSTDNPLTVTVGTTPLNITANFAEAGKYPVVANVLPDSTAGTVAPPNASYLPSTEVTLQATPATGYEFVGWTGDYPGNTGATPNPINPLVFTTPAEEPPVPPTPITVNAVFELIPTYSVNVTPTPVEGGAVNFSAPGPYPEGTQVTITAVPNTGYEFTSWSGDIGAAVPSVNPLVVTVGTQDLNIAANFLPEGGQVALTTVVAPDPSFGSVVLNPPGGLYAPGTSVTLDAVGALGYKFVQWSWTDPVTSDPMTSTTDPIVMTIGTAPLNVTATFEAAGPVTLNVTTAGDGSGSVTIDPVETEYTYGEIVTLTAEPEIGSVFGGWSGGATGLSNPLLLEMNGDKNVVANFILPGGPYSDNFSSCALQPMWGQFINPLGDAAYQLNGQQLLLTVPAGTSHNPWKGVNAAPRVMQQADNTDFQVIAKFDAPLTSAQTIQGIIVEQDDSNYLRFDFNRLADKNQNETTAAFAAKIIAGVPAKVIPELVITPTDAVYLRVTRVGDMWRMDFSPDGVAWTQARNTFIHPLNVTKIGVFVGNEKSSTNPSAPAHTAKIDYFYNTDDTPLPEDPPLLTVTTVGQGAVLYNPPIADMVCGQTVSLTAVPATGWAFANWSGDATGTSTPLQLLLNGPKSVTATFAPSGTITYRLFLSAVLR